MVGFVHLRDLLWDQRPDRPVADLVREIKRLPASKPVLAALSRDAPRAAHAGRGRRRVRRHSGHRDPRGPDRGAGRRDPRRVRRDPHQRRAGETSEVDGMLNLADFAERTGIELPDGPYETVGGFMMSALGRLPAAGDSVTPGGVQADRREPRRPPGGPGADHPAAGERIRAGGCRRRQSRGAKNRKFVPVQPVVGDGTQPARTGRARRSRRGWRVARRCRADRCGRRPGVARCPRLKQPVALTGGDHQAAVGQQDGSP